MTLPPLVERELRVASRQRNTYRFRIAAALIAVILGAAFIALTLSGAIPFGNASLGRGLFSVLTWMAFVTALGSGPFLTSDSLSQERREGTLGLLFLTSLRGREIVFSKLLSTSLRSGYAMLAILPVLGITLTLGGTGAAGFWKTVLALGTALEVSLAAGLLCSAVSREAQKALGLTLVTLAVLNLAGPAADVFRQANAAAPPVGRLFSPGYLFMIANAWGRVPFWTSLLANQAVAGVLLGLTCLVVRRNWREGGEFAGSVRSFRWPFASRRTAATRSPSARRRLEENPAYWLACRHGWLSRSLWVLSGLLAVGTLALGFVVGFDPGGPGGVLWMVMGSVWGLLALLLYLATAMQAVRLLAEARRSGVLELLLTTPLSEARIVDGQWRGMLRMVGQPLILCLLMQLAVTFISQWVSQEVTQRQVAAMATNAPPILIPGSTTNVVPVLPGPVMGAMPPKWISILTAVLSTVTFATNLAAIAWAGFWLGLVSRSANIATLKTLVYVQVFPAFIIGILSGLMVPILTFGTMTQGGGFSAGRMQSLTLWLPLLLVCINTVLSLAKDFGFIRWARGRLHAEFRQRATDALVPEISAPPPIGSSMRPTSPSVPTPPPVLPSPGSPGA